MPLSCVRRFCVSFSAEPSSGEGSLVVVVCATVESDNAELDDADREEFIAELGQEGPGAKEGGKMRA